MEINKNGIDLIKAYEGCKLKAYKDTVGIITQGWGHTGSDLVFPSTITQEKADAWLLSDLKRFEDGVSKLVTVKLTDNEFSALVCFVYNVGLGAFKSSTMLKLLNAGEKEDASNEFNRWNKASGKVVAGLTARRLAEKTLFLS